MIPRAREALKEKGTTMAILKLSQLKGACSNQRALFRKHFGTGGEVTLAKVEAVADLFDWDWAASHLLSPPAKAEYDKVRAAAWFKSWEADHGSL